MKIYYIKFMLALFVSSLIFPLCTLEEEPEVPTGASNVIAPVFALIDVIPDTNNTFTLNASLSEMGNLNILDHGWVWQEAPGPTIQDNKRSLGSLNAASFSTEIAGLAVGTIYYFRPYALTGRDTIYGEEHCSFLGVRFSINTDTEIFQGADVQFTNESMGNYTYLWNFGNGNTSTEASPKYTFNTKGATTVQLSVTNGGCTISKSIMLNVMDDPFQGYWVSLPGGSYTMGCTVEHEPCDGSGAELPTHQVTVKPFFIGKTEVTQKQWLAVVGGDNPSPWINCGDDCPIETISWNDINDIFIPALKRKTGRDHRLPSEAEWEYAARADTNTRYAGSDSLYLVAWYFIAPGNPGKPQRVAQLLPNKFGLYDMAGNNWEWMEDDWHENYDGAPTDGSAWIDNPRADERTLRGGSWGSGTHRNRISFRYGGQPTDFSDNIGFRLVRPQ